jgi:hypothetical protein
VVLASAIHLMHCFRRRRHGPNVMASAAIGWMASVGHGLGDASGRSDEQQQHSEERCESAYRPGVPRMEQVTSSFG